MRITLAFTLALLALPLALLAPVAAVAEPPRQLTLLAYDNPPFMDTAAGQAPRGLALDIVEELFRRLDTSIDIRVYPISRALALMDGGSADGIFTLKRTPEREAKYVYPREPLLVQDYVVFTNRDSPLTFKGDLKELANISIGMLDKTSYGPLFDAAAKRGAFKKLEVAQHHESNFLKLMAHRMDAVICSRRVGLAILKRMRASERVKIIGPPIGTAPSYLMFNRKAVTPLFLAQLDRELAGMRKDGTLRKFELQYSRD